MGTVQGMPRVRRGIVRAVGVVLLVGLVTTGAGHAFASAPSPTQGGVPLSQIQGDPFCFTSTSACYAASLTVDTTTGAISGNCNNTAPLDQCSIAGTLTGATASFTITYTGGLTGYTDSVNGTLSGTTITGSFVESYLGLPTGQQGSDFTFTGVTVIGEPVNPGPGGGTATPELGSGELLATGVLPILALALYRRRRSRRSQDDTTA